MSFSLLAELAVVTESGFESTAAHSCADLANTLDFRLFAEAAAEAFFGSRDSRGSLFQIGRYLRRAPRPDSPAGVLGPAMT
jgi:hypothetical protein